MVYSYYIINLKGSIMAKIIGVTGGIGSGKTTVAKILRDKISEHILLMLIKLQKM